jgi:hypothetical protein
MNAGGGVMLGSDFPHNDVWNKYTSQPSGNG